MERLETDRLSLRQWREEDSSNLYEYAKSDLVGPNAGWKPHKNEEESKEIIKMFIESNDVYAIVLKSENKVIGSIGLHDKIIDIKQCDLKQREIGYVLNPAYWGNGYVPEAVKRLLDYGFNELDLDLIWCGHYDFNSKSKRVNEKCGFKYKLTRDEEIKLLDNKKVKILYYNISKEEYIKK